MRAKRLSVLLFVSLFLLSGNVYARSGCCSHHGGVCGCSCCDGSSLSSTCAPYYPQCSGGGQEEQIYIPPTRYVPPPTNIPMPTKKPTFKLIRTVKPKKIPSIVPTQRLIQQDTNTTGLLGWLISLFK